MNKNHPIIDKNIDFIREHLTTHTLFWISKQIGLPRCTIYRFAKEYGFKGRDMKEALRREWTPAMLKKLRTYFPVAFNRELAEDLGVSMRTLIRKARELGLEKEPGFLDKNRKIISRMANANKPPVGQSSIDALMKYGAPYRFTSTNRPKNKPDFAKIWEKRRANAAAVQEALKKPY